MDQQSFKVFADARKKVAPGDGSIHQTPEGFWQFRPFSRITNWGKDFKQCIGYLKQNVLEAFGFVNYKPRKNYYAAWIKQAAPVFRSG